MELTPPRAHTARGFVLFRPLYFLARQPILKLNL